MIGRWARRMAFAAMLISVGLPLRAAEMPSVVLAVPALSLSFTTGYIAQDLGLFTKQGITVKEVDIAGLGSINSLISGSSDFAEASGASLTRAAARGQRLLAIAELMDRPFTQVVLRTSIADAAKFDPSAPLAQRALLLKDRTVAVDAINTVNHAYLRLVASAGGYDPETIHLGVMAAQSMIAAFQTKQIDGFAMTPPWPQALLVDGSAVLVASGPNGDPSDLVPLANSVLLTRPDTCEKKPELCEKIGHAYAEAALIIRDHPDQALPVLEKRFGKLDPKVIAASFAVLQKITPVPLAPTLDAIKANETFNVEAKLLKPEEALKSYDGLFTDKYVR